MNGLDSDFPLVPLRRLSSAPITNGLGEAGNPDNDEAWPRYIRTTDIATVRSLDPKKRLTLPAEIARQAPVFPYDILMTSAGATVGKSYIHLSGESACFAGYLSRWRVRRDRALPEFMAYFTESALFTSQVQAGAVKSTIENYSAAKYRATLAPVPSLAEQQAIVGFLDRETAQVDAFIAKNEELIALLTERRAAFVDGALRAASATTASMPLKRVVAGVTVGIVVTPSQWYADVGVPALRGLNVSAGSISTETMVYLSDEGHRAHHKSELRAGDVVVVRTGQAGAAAVVTPALDGANAIDLLIIRTSHRVLPEFLAHFLNSETAARMIAHGSVGSIQGHFNVGALRELPVPPLDLIDQRRIVEQVDNGSQRIDGAISTAQRSINLARERRAALISAAVTGKIDVGVSA